MSGTELDLGHGHTLTFLAWAPDDLPANRERYGYPLPSVPRAGAVVTHPARNGNGECISAIHFDLPELPRSDDSAGRSRWTVESWEPLTLSPSLLCRVCGDHGFIRQGKWEPA
jgi:hypothetical protein